jgi:hypothetical protein
MFCERFPLGLFGFHCFESFTVPWLHGVAFFVFVFFFPFKKNK